MSRFLARALAPAACGLVSAGIAWLLWPSDQRAQSMAFLVTAAFVMGRQGTTR